MKQKIVQLLKRLRQRIKLAILRLKGRNIVHVLHIGKTGGTAVKAALREHCNSGDFVITLNPHTVHLRDIPQGDQVVFFLRDPVARFVSGFLSRQRKGQPRYYTEWSTGEKAAFERFSTPNSLALALTSPDPEEQAAAHRAMLAIEHVKDSYIRWFESEAYFLSRLPDITLIGFQETLNDDFEQLKRMLSLPADLRLPSDPIKSHRNPENLDSSLGEQALHNLGEWYKSDFEFLELCRQQAIHKRH
jgi:hypothetical protein